MIYCLYKYNPHTRHSKLSWTCQIFPIWQQWREEGGGVWTPMACRILVNDLKGLTCCLISAVWVQIWLQAQAHQGHFGSVFYDWDKETLLYAHCTENDSQSSFLEQHEDYSDDKTMTGAVSWNEITQRSCNMPSPRCRLCPLKVWVSPELCFLLKKTKTKKTTKQWCIQQEETL